MPRHPPQRQINTVQQIVEKHIQGISLSGVLGKFEIKPARRTLQRWLSVLVQEKKIEQTGAGRGARYKPAFVRHGINYIQTEKEKSAEPTLRVLEKASEHVAAATPTELQVTPQAQEIRQNVRQTKIHRTPTGYKIAFLQDYIPNETYFLSKEIREKLARIGGLDESETPAGTRARQIFDRLLIDLSWNSSRLEGNTYSLLETERLLAVGTIGEGKDIRETQMLLNHKRAIEMLVMNADDIGFNRYTLLNLHAILAENLLANPDAAGRIRVIPVGIEGSVFHPMEGPQRIEETFDLILSKAGEIKDPFEQSFFAMVHIPYLQAFEDVNKRVSRLAANIPLIRMNLCPLSFVDVPQRDYVDGLLGVYELNRIELLRDIFVWAYMRSALRYTAIQQTLGEPDPFRMYHRKLLGEVVARVVQSRMDKQHAANFVRQEAQQLGGIEERQRFAEMAEMELMRLHEGNFARFQIRPSEFVAWKSQWE